eukprot:m.4562 g.4562  ORF g.4562 m.4562 type:complete len:909 (+) comp4344_c0_seq1:87-2813(+)
MQRGGSQAEGPGGDAKRTHTETAVRCIRRAVKVNERMAEAHTKFTQAYERFQTDSSFPQHDGLLFFTKGDGDSRGGEVDEELASIAHSSLQFQSTDNSRRNIVFAMKFVELLGIGPSFDEFLLPDAVLMARRTGGAIRSTCPSSFGLDCKTCKPNTRNVYRGLTIVCGNPAHYEVVNGAPILRFLLEGIAGLNDDRFPSLTPSQVLAAIGQPGAAASGVLPADVLAQAIQYLRRFYKFPGSIADDRPRAANRLVLPGGSGGGAHSGPSSRSHSPAHSPVVSDRGGSVGDDVSPSPSPRPSPLPANDPLLPAASVETHTLPLTHPPLARGRGLSAPTMVFADYLIPPDMNPEAMRELLRATTRRDSDTTPAGVAAALGAGANVGVGVGVGLPLARDGPRTHAADRDDSIPLRHDDPPLPLPLGRARGVAAFDAPDGMPAPLPMPGSYLHAPVVVIRESSFPTAPVRLVDFQLQPAAMDMVTSLLIGSAPPSNDNPAALDEISFDFGPRFVPVPVTAPAAAAAAGEGGGRAKSPRNTDEDDETGVTKASRPSRHSMHAPSPPAPRRGSRPATPRSREASPGRRSRDTSPSASLSRKSSAASLAAPRAGPRTSEPALDLGRAAPRLSEQFTSAPTQVRSFPAMPRHFSDAAVAPSLSWTPAAAVGPVSSAALGEGFYGACEENFVDQNTAAAFDAASSGLVFGVGSGGGGGVGDDEARLGRQNSTYSMYSETDMPLDHGALASHGVSDQAVAMAAMLGMGFGASVPGAGAWGGSEESMTTGGLLSQTGEAGDAGSMVGPAFNTSASGLLYPPAAAFFGRTSSSDPDGSVLTSLNMMAFSPSASAATLSPSPAAAHPSTSAPGFPVHTSSHSTTPVLETHASTAPYHPHPHPHTDHAADFLASLQDPRTRLG